MGSTTVTRVWECDMCHVHETVANDRPPTGWRGWLPLGIAVTFTGIEPSYCAECISATQAFIISRAAPTGTTED